MLWSKLFIPTLREAPAEAQDVAHRLLIRAAYMRRHDYLFLGRRSLRKMVAIIREELDAAGAQEFLGSSRLALLSIAEELRSYKQIPQLWYQFNGFNVECVGFRASAEEPLTRVTQRCGATAFSDQGDDLIVHSGGYTAHIDDAVSVATAPAAADVEGDLAPEPFRTPGQKTIADITAFIGMPETSQMKSVVMIADNALVLVMLRGDHQLSETKLARVLGAANLRPARADEIRDALGADPGSLGPVGITKVRVLTDEALRDRRSLICGANRNDYHLRNVTPGKDFEADFHDLRQVTADDTIEGNPLTIAKGTAVVRTWEQKTNLHVTNPSSTEDLLSASMSELKLDRLLSVAVKLNQDADGLALPTSVAPFELVITPVNIADATLHAAARDLYQASQNAGVDTLLDDRDERPGVKFKDADLIGIPYRVTIGKKLVEGMVELMDRRTRMKIDVPLGEAIGVVKGKLT